MPRTAIVPTVTPAFAPHADVELTFTTGDIVNNHTAPLGALIIVQNTDGVSPHTVTFLSVADRIGRVETRAVAIPATEFRLFPQTPIEGWKEASSSVVEIDVDDVQLLLAVIT